jgi:hypothetical protein
VSRPTCRHPGAHELRHDTIGQSIDLALPASAQAASTSFWPRTARAAGASACLARRMRWRPRASPPYRRRSSTSREFSTARSWRARAATGSRSRPRTGGQRATFEAVVGAAFVAPRNLDAIVDRTKVGVGHRRCATCEGDECGQKACADRETSRT